MSDIKARLMELREAFGSDVTAEVPVALLLSDVCGALGLGDRQRREVLGEAGAQYVDSVLGITVSLGKNGAR